MNLQREQMNVALKNIVVPHLRAHQFTGSFPHFRRKHDTHIDLITFQFNRYGGSFVVECAVCPTDGVTMYWGEHIPPNKVTAYHMNERYRLQHHDEQWFSYEQFETAAQFEALALFVKEQLHIESANWICNTL